MQTKAQFEMGNTERAKQGFDKLLAVPQLAANGEIYWMVLSDRAQIAEKATIDRLGPTPAGDA